MNSGADLNGIFIVLDVTALAFALALRQIGPSETDWVVISSEEAMGLARFVYFRSCFENVHMRRSRDKVQAI